MATITKRVRNKNKPWAVRWRDDTGHQREQAFKYKAEADVFKTNLEHAQLEGTFADPRRATDTFSEAAGRWLERLPVTPGTKAAYGNVLGKHINPVIGDRLLRHVAQDRDAVADIVNVSMAHMSRSRRDIALIVITGVLDEAVQAGRLPRHRCAGIRVAPGNHAPDRKDFVFPSHAQLTQMADSLNGMGLTIWLMRGCGLRISETLAVRKEGFREHGSILRINEQVTINGQGTAPLKHRKTGDWREIPAPSYLWEQVKNLPDGYLFRRPDGRFPIYTNYLKKFTAARTTAGIPDGFTPHSLRHAFVSALLARHVPIHDVARWLGHKSIDETYLTYSHLIPSALGNAREALDAEYKDWSEAE